MCFSAEASFTVSAVLFTTGIISLKKVINPMQFAFACIPLIFSIQQLSEGMVWLSFTHAEYAEWKTPSLYFFLFFAQVVWPVWVPMSFLFIEKEAVRRRILSGLLYTGITLSVYLSYCLFNYYVRAEIIGSHIRYELFFPYYLRWFSGLFYFFPTVISSFVSSVKKTWVLGILILGSYLISALFFKDYLISVWCFFAAIISCVILIILHSLKKEAGSTIPEIKPMFQV